MAIPPTRCRWPCLILGVVLLLPACRHTVPDTQFPTAEIPPRQISARETRPGPIITILPGESITPVEPSTTEPPTHAAASKPESPEQPEAPAKLETDVLSPPALPPLDDCPPDHTLLKALEAYLEDRPDEALALLSAYEPADQELLIRLLPIIARVEKGGLLTAQLTDEEKLNLLESLRSLSNSVRATAPLLIGKLMFCEEVKGFGRSNPRETSVYRAGERVCLYVEVLNLADRRTSGNRYETRLRSELEIRNGGRPVRTLAVQSLPDWSWSPRSDHFTVIQFRLPRDLEAGLYSLHVRITDEDTHRTAEKQLPFRVSAAPTME